MSREPKATPAMREDILDQAKAAISHEIFYDPDEVRLVRSLIAEVEACQALVDRTAKKILKLQPGIRWEGGIDDAMAAIVAEVERLRSSGYEAVRV